MIAPTRPLTPPTARSAFAPRPLAPVTPAPRFKVFTPAPAALAREGDRPAVLWRESLTVVTGRLARLEAWAFLALVGLTLPAAAINQSGLWHLLNSGALDRAVRAFLFPGNL